MYHAAILTTDVELVKFFVRLCPCIPDLMFNVFVDTRVCSTPLSEFHALFRDRNLPCTVYDGTRVMADAAAAVGIKGLQITARTEVQVGDRVTHRGVTGYIVDAVYPAHSNPKNPGLWEARIRHLPTGRTRLCGRTRLSLDEHFDARTTPDSFYSNFALTLKLTIPVYMYTTQRVSQILYLDDDCIMTGDVRPLFKHRLAMSRDGFRKMEDQGFLDAFNRVCACNLTCAEYNAQRMSAGVMMLTYTESLLASISRFFAEKDFCTMHFNNLNKYAKYNESFFLEQYFYNVFFMSQGCTNFTSAEVSAGSKTLFMSRSLPRLGLVCHYGVGQFKHQWIAKYIELLERER